MTTGPHWTSPAGRTGSLTRSDAVDLGLVVPTWVTAALEERPGPTTFCSHAARVVRWDAVEEGWPRSASPAYSRTRTGPPDSRSCAHDNSPPPNFLPTGYRCSWTLESFVDVVGLAARPERRLRREGEVVTCPGSRWERERIGPKPP